MRKKRAAGGPHSPAPAELDTLRDFVNFAARRFRSAQLHFGHGTGNARDEAAYLMLHAMGLPPHDLDPFLGRRLSKAERASALRLIEQRIAERVPAPYLTREAWLRGHRFYVDERVIVPRSFIAELLPEGLDPWLADPDSVHDVLDLCTGSGCLAILASLAFPGAMVDAVELSADALEVARRNVKDYGLNKRVHLIESDLFAGLGKKRFDVILSNPPYVDARAMRTLPEEYRKEPALALAAGKDGLDIVRRILKGARSHLKAHGILVVEVGHNRAALEAAYPRLPFMWLDVSAGDEFVFLLTRRQLSALPALSGRRRK
jgi:ribosomal protein L3 glutamine methyltransferase